MDSEEILALYAWRPGICFRHPERGEIDTVLIKTLHPRTGPVAMLRACRDCVLALEAVRAAAAVGAGTGYEPGRLSEEEGD